MLRRTPSYRWLLACLLTVLVASTFVVAEAAAQKTGAMPPQLEGTGIDEQLGAFVSTETVFLDEEGDEVALSTFFDGERPVLLAPIYQNCPMLCNLVLQGLTEALSQMAWTPGEEFEVVALSFNPRETPAVAAEKKTMYMEMLGRPDAASGMHFLTGSEAAIHAVTDAVGFSFKWIEEKQEYAHPSALIFLSGNGKVSRYLYGIDYKPSDVRTALVEASEGNVGSALDQALLYCFQYDPNENSYVLHAQNLMKLGGMLTIVLLGGILLMYWRKESHRSWQEAAA